MALTDRTITPKDRFDPPHDDMARHVASGVFNSGIVQAVKLICQFGTVIVLSRLLPPTDFGLLAMVNPIVGFAGLFQSLGLNESIVQKKRLLHDEVNAIFWINSTLGLVLSLLLALLSPVVGWYYGDPRVAPLTAALSGIIFISSLGNQHGTILQRRMKFGALTVIDVTSTFSALAVAIICALILKSYWALYWGTIVGYVFPVIGAWIASDWRPSRPRRVSGLTDMLKFGAGITSFGFTNFFARNLDNILIGRRWGGQALGFYDRAYKLMLFPLQRIVGPLEGVMIPLLSRITDDEDRYSRAFLRVLSQMTLAVWPGVLWAFIFADTLVPTLLGPSWLSAADIFRPLAIVGLLQVANGSASWLFISQGRSADYARWGVINAISCIIAFVVGLPYGAYGVAVAYAVGELICTPFLWWYVTRRGPVTSRHIRHAVAPQIISISISLGILLACRGSLEAMSPWIRLICGAVMVYAVTGVVMFLLPDGRKTLEQAVAFLRQASRQLTAKNTPAQSLERMETSQYAREIPHVNDPHSKISIIVAAHNAGATIGRAVASALAEPCAGDVIVADDASTDDTVARARAADDGTGRLKIIIMPVNVGPAAARNRALQAAKDEWVGILDADDFFLPGRLSGLLKFSDQADFVADDIWRVDESDIDGPRQLFLRTRLTTSRAVTFLEFVTSNITDRKYPRGELGFIKPIMRRSFLEAHDLRYQGAMRLGEDYELYARALAYGARLILVPAQGYVSVVRANSLSGNHSEDDLRNLRDCDLQLITLPALDAKDRAALRKHYLSVDCRLQGRLLIEAFKSRDIRAGVATFCRPMPVPVYLLGQLVEQLVLRTTKIFRS